jgi:hypothetical protein
MLVVVGRRRTQTASPSSPRWYSTAFTCNLHQDSLAHRVHSLTHSFTHSHTHSRLGSLCGQQQRSDPVAWAARKPSRKSLFSLPSSLPPIADPDSPHCCYTLVFPVASSPPIIPKRTPFHSNASHSSISRPFGTSRGGKAGRHGSRCKGNLCCPPAGERLGPRGYRRAHCARGRLPAAGQACLRHLRILVLH